MDTTSLTGRAEGQPPPLWGSAGCPGQQAAVGGMGLAWDAQMRETLFLVLFRAFALNLSLMSTVCREAVSGKDTSPLGALSDVNFHQEISMVMDYLVHCPSGGNLASGGPRPGHQHQATPEFPNSTLNLDPSDGSMRKE